ncbi:hypothetical protein [Paeniglutamicibacter kerguelensis]|uniref:Uncharacterized protein n=1 Tax=Paeniglutamicibacter kerguelensis TaxID=254788 RepID=A0ABS4XED4_9MICC|nr:hypothetical protein [Paeniglutamicibacter kerguelensis]MBP2386820.1 hypothetical protein [Paeniglutamicibacter kerguelensis]
MIGLGLLAVTGGSALYPPEDFAPGLPSLSGCPGMNGQGRGGGFSVPHGLTDASQPPPQHPLWPAGLLS